MPDAIELIKTIKKTSVDAVEAGKPVNVCYGKVASSSPLKITVSQKLVLSEKQLVLTERVTEHSIYATVTDNPDTNPVSEKKLITYHNGLAAGDRVVLLRVQGGQKYVVLDRAGT